MEMYGNGYDHKLYRLLHKGWQMNTGIIDGKLNRRCHIKVLQSSGLFELLKLYDERMETYFFVEEKTASIQIYLQKKFTEAGHLSILKNRTDLLDLGNYFSITEDIGNYNGNGVVKDILEIPSVIVADSYLMGNELHFIFKYHSNYGKKISDALSHGMLKSPDIYVEEIGQPRKFMDDMMEINKENPLVVFQSSSVLPNETGILFDVAREYPDTVTEIDPRSITIGGLRAISYATQAIHIQNITEISKDTFIYETRQLVSVMMKRREELIKHRIPRMAAILELRGDRIFNTTFLPEASAKMNMNIYLNTDFKIKKYNPRIEVYSRLSDDIWEYL